ncbi:hypothetical protein P7L78_22165 [Tistrella bauzanensis]|uniref:hypothetical protein n=1 Tax=Tistrella TaxID=171436 RepID=UPI0031F695F9
MTASSTARYRAIASTPDRGVIAATSASIAEMARQDLHRILLTCSAASDPAARTARDALTLLAPQTQAGGSNAYRQVHREGLHHVVITICRSDYTGEGLTPHDQRSPDHV